MKLRSKFNLAFLGCFAAGLLAGHVVLRDLLQEQARDQSVRMAQLMLDTALAVRSYTQTEIAPALDHGGERFRPQTVPAYAATQTLLRLQGRHEGYSYRETVLNPTNPSNRPSSFERELIERFRAVPGTADQIGETVQAGVPLLYISRPIKVGDGSCMACHDTPAKAPAAMVASYGTGGGFGWKLQETIGAQVITVPMDVPLEHAEQTLQRVLAIYIGFAGVTLVLLNLLLSRLIIAPVERLSRAATAISMGALDHPVEAARSKDEIGELHSSIGRLGASVRHALRMLATQSSRSPS
jgi:HAMP domain-containing protein